MGGKTRGIREALLACAEAACEAAAPPAVAAVYLPEPCPNPARDAEFGAVMLEDGSAGLYYAWLGPDQQGMAEKFPAATLVGMPALALAARYLDDDIATRSLALAAINALTSWAWRRQGHVPPAATDSLCGVALSPGETVGFIGNFPPLVRRLREQGHPVRVVERKAHMLQEAPGLVITLDPAVLVDCPVVFGTAAMLLNDSLDDMLPWCRSAREIALLGPTAGCFPEPLFARGITRIGGLQLLDAATAIQRMREDGKWQADCARRFLLEA